MADARGDLGSRLRAAREARSISLKQIATTTKISVLALEALERNDASRLPGGLFSRAFVRAYAKEVGLDPEQTVREFVERFEEEGAGDQSAPVRVRTASGGESGNQYRLRWIGLGVTVLLVVAWIGLDRYFARRAELPATQTRAARKEAGPPIPAAPALPTPELAPVPSVPIEQPAPTPDAASTIPPSQTAPPPSQQAPPQSPPAAQGVQPQPPAAAPPAEAPTAAEPSAAPRNLALNMVLTTKSACWISASADGQRIAGRTLQPGEKLELSADRSIVLTAGDAASLSYTINNAPGRALGAAGEVKTVVITTANYQTFLTGRQ